MPLYLHGNDFASTGRTDGGQLMYGHGVDGDGHFMAQRLTAFSGHPNGGIAEQLLRRKVTAVIVSAGQQFDDACLRAKGSDVPSTTSNVTPSEISSEYHSEQDLEQAAGASDSPEHVELDLRGISEAGPCTAILKNIPYQSTQESIAETLDAFGLQGMYDTVYIPRNPTRKGNLGYACVSFLRREHLQECHRLCDNKPFGGAPPTKLCRVLLSSSQGIKGPKASCTRGRAGQKMAACGHACRPLVVAEVPPPRGAGRPASAPLRDALVRFGAPAVAVQRPPPPPAPPTLVLPPPGLAPPEHLFGRGAAPNPAFGTSREWDMTPPHLRRQPDVMAETPACSQGFILRGRLIV